MSVRVLTLAAAIALVASEQPASLNGYNNFVKTPSGSIQTGGRLTERQIAYIAQDGYKSYLSVVEFPTNDTSFNGVEGPFPSTEYEMTIAQGLGMNAKYVVSNLTAESAYVITDIIKGMEQPLYIHCHVSFSLISKIIHFISFAFVVGVLFDFICSGWMDCHTLHGNVLVHHKSDPR